MVDIGKSHNMQIDPCSKFANEHSSLSYSDKEGAVPVWQVCGDLSICQASVRSSRELEGALKGRKKTISCAQFHGKFGLVVPM